MATALMLWVVTDTVELKEAVAPADVYVRTWPDVKADLQLPSIRPGVALARV